jgi:hypothetical protein
MSPLRAIYLTLAIWGALHPMFHFGKFYLVNGFDFEILRDALSNNAASTGLVWDLAIAFVALTVWVIAEVAVRRNWIALIAIPASICFGLGCGLPLYLFLRTRPVT